MDGRSQSGFVYLDTHVVVWLYDGLVDKLSEKAGETIEKGLLRVSPFVVLELEYLHEIGRLRPDGQEVLDALSADIGLQESDPPLRALVRLARELSWTRDPFDRLVTAEALLERALLVTRDKTIREHCAQAVW